MKANNLITGSLILVFILTGFTIPLSAQDAEGMKKFHEEKVNFFNEKLNLSDAEAKKFWPVHDDFHNRMMKINEEERTLLNYYNENSDAMSDKEVDETLEKFLDLQKRRVDLGAKYHLKFVEILGKRKTMKMYSLDREFRMHLLRKFRSGGDRAYEGKPDSKGDKKGR